MRGHRIIAALFVVAVACCTATPVAAAARRLVLSTAGQGPIERALITWTSSSANVTFGEDEICPITPADRIVWEVDIEHTGATYVGHVQGKNTVSCKLNTGPSVTIKPDPNPLLVKLGPSGKAHVSGRRKVQLIAGFADGSTCTYVAGKMPLTFPLAEPHSPIPLEPGDPQIPFKLMKKLSGAGCPGQATESLQFSVSYEAPGGEEAVLVEA